MTRLRIFVASPGDVSEERDITSHVVGELNRMFGSVQIFGNPFDMQLEAVRWETHSFPDVGDDAQDVINRQIGRFDVLVGIMWRRFGTATKRAKSGTGEEFQRAFQLFKEYQRPRIMFYFRTTPFYTTDLHEISQFRRVVEFRRQLEKLGVLFWSYDKPITFERNVREHLIRQVFSLTNIRPDFKPPEKPSRDDESGGSVPGPTKPPPHERPEIGVFLAYSRRDREEAREIYRLLRSAGFRPWLDEQDLLPGQMWKKEIDRAIRKMDVVLLLISQESDLTTGFLAKELRAITQRLKSEQSRSTIAVRLDQVELPLELKHIPAVDYFLPGGMEQLCNAVANLTGSQFSDADYRESPQDVVDTATRDPRPRRRRRRRRAQRGRQESDTTKSPVEKKRSASAPA